MTDPLQKAQERLSLHELIRVGVGRQEDLRLLQNVAMQAACLPAASVTQLLREAALREEWRSGREASLLAQLRSQPLGGLLGLGPGGCLSAADGRLLSEQVAALTEMLEQQQRRRRSRTASSGPASRAGGPYRTATTPTRAPGSAPGLAGGVLLRPYLTPLGGRPPPSPSPSQQQHQPQPANLGEAGRGAEWLSRQQQQRRPASTPAGDAHGTGLVRSASAGSESSGSLGCYDPLLEGATAQRPRRLGSSPAGSGAASTSAGAIYSAAAAVVGSPARALRSSGRGGTAQPRGGAAALVQPGSTGQVSSPQGRAAARGSSPGRGGRPRPGTAPDGPAADAWGAGRAAGVEPSIAASAAAAAAAAAAVNSPVGAAGGGSPAAEGAARSSGFRNLLRLQQLLMQGLREHAQDEGEGGALEALTSSVAEGQAFFTECLADALEAAGLPPDAVPLPASASTRVLQAQGAGQGPVSPVRLRVPVVAWDRMLRLGHLGLTRGDVARLEEMRRQRAARVIQRQVRKWLRRRRHQRRLAEARARADAMQRRLRDRAARIIQAWVRGHLARRLAARLTAQAAVEREQCRRAEAARAAAATRIQRAWRAHRRAVRYSAALARAEELRKRKQQQLPARGSAEAGRGQAQEPHAEPRPRGQEQHGKEQGRRGQPGGGASSMALERAVVKIQSHLRGWLVRRSSAMWWARASLSLRERRAAVRAWQQHQRFMTASYDMQAQLLGAMVREAQVVAALEADRRRQEAEMRAAFNEWLLQQQRVALSQPLPRGWVPHPHPEEPGRMCFLNTRTGELHSLHPAVAELARHAREQHAAASTALERRFTGLPAYLAQLHTATAAQAGIAMRAIAIMYQSAGAAGAGAGGAS